VGVNTYSGDPGLLDSKTWLAAKGWQVRRPVRV